MNDRLTALAAQVSADLSKITHPSMPWLTPVTAPDGRPALDVLIVGAGQSGLAIAFALQRSQVTNILVLDKAEQGSEGPWLTYARMPALRSPKSYTGPDLDVPSLTYQAWHEAKFGEASWRDLDLISRECWADYLSWYRHVLDLPVRNGCELIDIAPAAHGVLKATIRSARRQEAHYARKIVLATGQEGMGDWSIPKPLKALPASRCVHCAAPIDFDALRGKRVAVIGAGASAFDNAAMALEAGAATVHLLCRRAEMQLVQPYRWLTFRGFPSSTMPGAGASCAPSSSCARDSRSKPTIVARDTAAFVCTRARLSRRRDKPRTGSSCRRRARLSLPISSSAQQESR
jgi:FAD-dependent urate hydroxylase